MLGDRWRRSVRWGREAAMDSCSVVGCGFSAPPSAFSHTLTYIYLYFVNVAK